MTDTLAYDLPFVAPHEVVEHPRHIEIVSTRSQRRARPRIVYALVGVAGLFLILVAQLLISIVLSDGAYQIASLQSSQKELVRDQQTLSERQRILESPQNLAGRASALGMVGNVNGEGWLRLSDGKILSSPTAAEGTAGVDPSSGSTVTNALLTPELLAQQEATAKTPAPGTIPDSATPVPATAVTPGAPGDGTTAGAVASEAGGIPAPQTH
ncbi:hypothetical protein [Lacisediminihabitans changchengi]|uniref:Cell division protein FtsL n=1 Tax=Lacisediminihabitans changchengi TaxID=2787634 RepID=A0A934SRR3_9MICO|nr:hypothetical protein [Lacisediminihabitans changchengi]MBK4347750.1 hypothetical protein [Lacisediminihabitans changchengi]